MLSLASHRMLRTSLLLVALWGLATSAFGTEVILKEIANPAGSVMRLKDLAEVRSEDESVCQSLEALELFPVPLTSRSISAMEVRDRLELLGVDLWQIELQGARSIRIEVGANTVDFESRIEAEFIETQSTAEVRPASFLAFDEQAVERFCRSRTERLLETEGWEWNGLSISDESRRVLERGCRWLGAEVDRQSLSTQQPIVRMAVEVDGSRVFLPMVVFAQPLPRVVFLKQVVERGTVLTEEHVTLRPWPRRDLSRATANLEDVIGREVRGSVQVDRPIDPAQLTLPQMVKRNTEVRIGSNVPEIRVFASGKALADGAMGDVIQVQLSDPRRPVRARVTGPGEVVLLGSGQ